jgi:hypothetical protein
MSNLHSLRFTSWLHRASSLPRRTTLRSTPIPHRVCRRARSTSLHPHPMQQGARSPAPCLVPHSWAPTRHAPSPATSRWCRGAANAAIPHQKVGRFDVSATTTLVLSSWHQRSGVARPSQVQAQLVAAMPCHPPSAAGWQELAIPRSALRCSVEEGCKTHVASVCFKCFRCFINIL